MSEQASASRTSLIGLLLVGLGAMVVPLDSAVNIGFDAIAQRFAIAPHLIHWIVVVYVLTQTCLTIVFGKLADRHGHRRLFMTGLVIVTLAFFLCAAASSYAWLTGWRMLQGVGAGLLLACAPALSTFVVPAQDKRYALSVYTMLSGVGLLIGPLLGGILVQLTGWSVVFWMRAPIALLALFLLWRLTGTGTSLPMQSPPSDRTQPFDVRGSIALILMLAAAGAFMLQVHQAWTGALSRWICLPVLIGAGYWLLMENRRASDPVLDLRYFRLPGFAALQFGAALMHFCTFSLFLFLPYTLAAWPDLSLGGAGLVLAMFPAGMVLAGFTGARLSAAIATGTLIWLGLLLCAFALALCGWLVLANSTAVSTLIWMALTMLVSGIGAGIFQVGHLDATTTALPIEARGVAGSIAAVTRVIGIVFAASGLFWIHIRLGGDSQNPFSYGPTILLSGLLLALYGCWYYLRYGRQRP